MKMEETASFRWKKQQEERGGIPGPALGKARHHLGELRKGKVMGAMLRELH